MDSRARRSFYEVLNAALRDVANHGYDSATRIEFWVNQLKESAAAMLGPAALAESRLRAGLGAVYRALVDRGELLKRHPGVSKFTLANVAPRLRGELDRRIVASASLIKLNREEAVEKTLRRFRGWSTSIPAGGSKAVNAAEERKSLKKALTQLPFVERRVLIDQGHKLRASISETLARDTQALAVIWHSHWRQANYDYREDHKERDGQVYLLKNTWAVERGLVKPGTAGWYEDITSVGEEPFCRCYAQWIYALRALPADMLTKKGADELARVRVDSEQCAA